MDLLCGATLIKCKLYVKLSLWDMDFRTSNTTPFDVSGLEEKNNQ